MAETRGTRGLTRRGPTLWLIAVLLLFAGSTYIALNQKPRLDPFQKVNPLDLDFWLHPFERNAFARLQYIPSSLVDIFSLPGTDKVWAVGYGGPIVHSNDGGITWQQHFARGHQQQQQRQQQLRPQAQSKKDAKLPLPELVTSAYAQTSVVPRTLLKRTEQSVQPQATRALLSENLIQPDSDFSGGQLTTNLRAAHFVDRNRGWVVVDNGTILQTLDSGTTWTAQMTNTSVQLSAMSFVQGPQDWEGWAVGKSGTILTSFDGGTNWRPQQGPVRVDFNAVHFVGSSHGWVVGENGTIFSTTSGGNTWNRQPNNNYVSLRAIYFVSQSHGWAAGKSGTILHTINGGTSWLPQPSPTDQDLFSIHFSSPSQGWIAGKGKEILHTLDGGDSWTSIASPAAWLFSVHFSSSAQGWILGRGTRILRTEDAGRSCTFQTSNSTPALLGVNLSRRNRVGPLAEAESCYRLLIVARPVHLKLARR